MQTLLFVLKIKHRALVSRIICGAFVGIVALWILPTVYRGFRDGPRSNSWPQVEGIVLDHKVVPVDREGAGARLGLRLVYQYEVEGTQYTGSKIDVAGTLVVLYGELAQELQQRAENDFPRGDPIEVYYDPSNPADAVLVTGIVPTTYWQLLFVVFIVSAYVYFIYTSDRKRRPQSSSQSEPESPSD